ncbi:MAG: Gfo/Idh/MocA family oxidoreductase [Butyrivibrio sp.]|nr:Gfo/Idh/MocA family oxidoreductase [Butyrivibrio sp.]
MLNEKQATQIFKYAEEKGVFVSEAMWTRFMPLRTKLSEILASHVIGEPTMLTANLSYNIAWKKRIQEPSLGGGALLDIGVYCLNFASMVFGNDVSDISSMCTYNANGLDEQENITLRYKNGQMASLSVSTLGVSDRSGIIYGTKGYIVVDNINNFESITVYDAAYNKVGFYKKPKQITGYEYEIQSCVRAIKEGWKECPEMPHAETLKMLNMMDFIRKNLGITYPVEASIDNQSYDSETKEYVTNNPVSGPVTDNPSIEDNTEASADVSDSENAVDIQNTEENAESVSSDAITVDKDIDHSEDIVIGALNQKEEKKAEGDESLNDQPLDNLWE